MIKKKILFLSLFFFMMFVVSPSFAGVRSEKGVYYVDDAVGSAVIKDGKKAAAREDAKRAAYLDAIEKTFDACVSGISNMNNYKNTREKAFSKSSALVKNFKITNESVDGDTLTITGTCQVSEKAIDGFLGPEVISMLGNPRVMILVDESTGNYTDLVEGEISKLFERAGYLIVDAEQAKTLIALDPKKAFSDPEMLAGAAKTMKADIIIVAQAKGGSSSFNRYGVKIYNSSASAQVKAVLTKTAYRISSQTASAGKKNSLQGGIGGLLTSCVDRATEEIIYKIAYKMASAGSLGGITVNIKIANAKFKDVEDIEERLREFAGSDGHLFERAYENNVLEVDLVSNKTSRNVASFLSEYADIEGLTTQTINARILGKVTGPVVVSTPEEKIAINIHIENVKRFEEATEIERDLKDFIGNSGEITSNYQDMMLDLTVTYSSDAQNMKNSQAIAEFLKGIDIRTDSVKEDSITAWKRGGWLW